MAQRAMVGAAIALGGVIAGCAFQRAEIAEEAQASLVGMSKEQIISCMGPPANVAAAGATEVLSYNSGNGRTDSFGVGNAIGGYGSATAFGSSITTSRFCKVDLVFNRGRVSRVNYSGPTGGLLTGGEQCAYAVNNCVKEAASVPVAPVAALQAEQSVPVETAPQPASTAPASLCTPEEAAQEQAAAREITAQGFKFRGRCN